MFFCISQCKATDQMWCSWKAGEIAWLINVAILLAYLKYLEEMGAQSTMTWQIRSRRSYTRAMFTLFPPLSWCEKLPVLPVFNLRVYILASLLRPIEKAIFLDLCGFVYRYITGRALTTWKYGILLWKRVLHNLALENGGF